MVIIISNIKSDVMLMIQKFMYINIHSNSLINYISSFMHIAQRLLYMNTYLLLKVFELKRSQEPQRAAVEAHDGRYGALEQRPRGAGLNAVIIAIITIVAIAVDIVDAMVNTIAYSTATTTRSIRHFW